MTDVGSFDPAKMEAEAAAVATHEPADPWLARRLLTFGASEIPALMIAIGLDQPTNATPRYVTDLASRIFGVKAGTRKAGKAGRAAQVGNDVELELLQAWNADPLSGYPPAAHASSIPREWLPLVDRHCPRLSCTPDAWLRQSDGLVNVQIKTDIRGGKIEVAPWWRTQVQAEMAVTGSVRSVLLYGGGWACDWADRRESPYAWEVERDDEEIERIRSAVRAGWTRVEEIKESKER